MTEETKELLPNLLPCPFCGGEAQSEDFYLDDGVYAVECRKCGGAYHANTNKQSIEGWNTRTPQPPNPDKVPGLISALKDISRMSTLPDKTCNTYTLSAARMLAKQALVAFGEV